MRFTTVLSSSDQVGGFSGQRLNINYLSDSCDLESGVMSQEICASFPYSIGSGLPHLQEPWAALVDSGAVTSIAPSSFAPHVPITPHSGQLVNVNGGEIKIKGQKKVTYVTHMVVMHITFIIVEDVLNPIIGLDALHQNAVQFHLFQTGKAYLQQRSQKAILHYHKHHYYASGLVLSGYVKSSILKWDDPQYTIFDPQSRSQIIAEIDFEVNSEARMTQSQEEEDVSLESQKPQCLKIPESVTAAERKAHSLTHMPFRSWCTVCQRANGQHQHHKGNQKITSVTQLDHSFYKVPGETQNLKVLTFVETITSMSGAVIVPDLSANQVAIKALKKFIPVNGFTKSVLQCDGQVRAIRIGLADHLNVDADHLDAAFFPWIMQHATFQINRFLVRSDGKTSFEKVFKKPQRSPIVHFGGTCSCSHSVSTPSSKVADSCLTSKVIWTLARQGCYHRDAHVTLMDGQILRTRTIITSYSRRSVQVGRIQEVQDCCSWIKCRSQGRFLWSDALQGSCSQVLASTKESGHFWVFRERLQGFSLSGFSSGIFSSGSAFSSFSRGSE